MNETLDLIEVLKKTTNVHNQLVNLCKKLETEPQSVNEIREGIEFMSILFLETSKQLLDQPDMILILSPEQVQEILDSEKTIKARLAKTKVNETKGD